jgi:hypothetical protein
MSECLCRPGCPLTADDASIYAWEHDPEHTPRTLERGERDALRLLLDHMPDCDEGCDICAVCRARVSLSGYLDETEEVFQRCEREDAEEIAAGRSVLAGYPEKPTTPTRKDTP